MELLLGRVAVLGDRLERAEDAVALLGAGASGLGADGLHARVDALELDPHRVLEVVADDERSERLVVALALRRGEGLRVRGALEGALARGLELRDASRRELLAGRRGDGGRRELSRRGRLGSRAPRARRERRGDEDDGERA